MTFFCNPHRESVWWLGKHTAFFVVMGWDGYWVMGEAAAVAHEVVVDSPREQQARAGGHVCMLHASTTHLRLS